MQRLRNDAPDELEVRKVLGIDPGILVGLVGLAGGAGLEERLVLVEHLARQDLEPLARHAADVLALLLVELDAQFVAHLRLLFEAQLLERVVEHVLPVHRQLQGLDACVLQLADFLSELRPFVVELQQVLPLVHEYVEAFVQDARALADDDVDQLLVFVAELEEVGVDVFIFVLGHCELRGVAVTLVFHVGPEEVEVHFEQGRDDVEDGHFRAIVAGELVGFDGLAEFEADFAQELFQHLPYVCEEGLVVDIEVWRVEFE